jgi:hypothetical protein
VEDKHKYDRIDWKKHLQELEAADPYHFNYMYHMSQQAFNKLVDLLGDRITVNKVKRRASTNNKWSNSSRPFVGPGLRYFDADYLKSIRDIFGISPSST